VAKVVNWTISLSLELRKKNLRVSRLRKKRCGLSNFRVSSRGAKARRSGFGKEAHRVVK